MSRIMLKNIPIGIILAILWSVLQVCAQVGDPPTITTQSTTVKGKYRTSYEGRQYESYEGIPYAIPPTGSRRFQPPTPITLESKGVIDATQDPPRCIQYDYEAKSVVGQEDCLYLSIYTPAYNKNSSLPVIVWFHEGGFQRGAGNFTKAKYIIDRDIIFVTMNYRLSIFGFLSTADEIVPGNMGLKDQNLALKWVAQNIRHFGGDPKKVSLMGASAGASSVHYHYLSKMSAGLFRNGISFSGTALSPWAYNPKPLETAKRLAETVGCPADKTREMVECLRKKDVQKLAEASRDLLSQTSNTLFYFPFFMPVAEKTTKNYFVNKSPEEILKKGDVTDLPWVTGVVSEEGATSMAGIGLNQTALTYLDEHWEPRTSYIQIFNDTLPMSKHPELVNKARRHYIGDDRPFKVSDNKTLWGLTYMSTHETFHISFEKAARLQALVNKSPVFAYYYSYRAAQSNTDHLSNSNFNFGVCHLDDVSLVLENPYMNPTVTSSDKMMLKKMIGFWYSTATTGQPDLEKKWPSVNPKSKEFTFMHIAGPNQLSVNSSDNFADKQFWSSVGYELNV